MLPEQQNIIQIAYKVWKSLIELDKHMEAYNITEDYLMACGLTLNDFHNYILEKNGLL